MGQSEEFAAESTKSDRLLDPQTDQLVSLCSGSRFLVGLYRNPMHLVKPVCMKGACSALKESRRLEGN